MSKAKRKVTVDAGKSVPDDSERRKPSVFERLGPGGVRKPAYAEESEVIFDSFLLILPVIAS